MSDPYPPQPPPPPGPPPQQYPQPQYPQQYPQPQYAQPTYAPTGPAPKPKGNKGCLVAIVLVFVLLIGGGVAVVVALNWAGNKVSATSEQVLGPGGLGGVEQCPYISNAEATDAIGTPAEANLFTGGLGKVMNITDARVLTDQSSCIMQPATSSSSTGMPGLGRAVKYTGSDASTRYQQELTKAKGVTEDRGNGLSVSTDSYFNKDVSGLGDEAFCTKSSGTLAGVLTRRGDTLVYVAISRASDAPPGIDLGDPDDPKLGTDDEACTVSQTLAEKILAG